MAAPSEVDEDVAYLLDGTTTSVEGGTGNEFKFGSDALEELVVVDGPEWPLMICDRVLLSSSSVSS